MYFEYKNTSFFDQAPNQAVPLQTLSYNQLLFLAEPGNEIEKNNLLEIEWA